MSRLYRTLLSICLFAGIAAAKSADDYLHGGAARYVQGRLQEAAVEVEEGLRQYPRDSRLKALSDQLKKMKDQQKQDQGGSNSQGGDGSKEKDKQDSAQGNQGQQKDQQGKQDQDKQDKQKDEGKDKDGKDQDKNKDNGGEGEKPPQPDQGKEGDSTGKPAAPVKPGQMSKEEAERLLNSYQDDEKREQKNLQKRFKKPVEVEEDW
jgi:hypothetical protein